MAPRPELLECGWCGHVFRPGPTGRMPKWCSPTCRHRAWEQSRVAASGRCAIEVIERRVEVSIVVERKVTVSPRGLAWLSALSDLERQLDTGRLYDRDLPTVITAINAVCAAAARRLRHR